MTIKLDTKESEKFFHNALCNGMSYVSSAGLEFSYKQGDYTKAQKSLKAKIKKGEIPHEMYVPKGDVPSICREDVWMEILRNGGKLKMIDHEFEGEYTKSIGLTEVHERVEKADKRWLLEMEDNEDDASTAFEILQQVFFEESVFG